MKLPRLFAIWLSMVWALGLGWGGSGSAMSQGLLITEFAAVNSGGIVDEFGDSSDWIEIHNPTPNDVDLAGWYLTDNPVNLTKWRFSAINLGPQQFLVVFASGRNTNSVNAHTSFKMSSNGGFLALVRPDGRTIAHQYGQYPPQTAGVTYGLAMVGLDLAGTNPGFLNPSPRLANGSFLGLGPEIFAVNHSPSRPKAGDAITVLADVRPRSMPIGSVTLSYRVMYDATEVLPMRDDGQHGDGAAGDGIYGAAVPGGSGLPGQMVRWHLRAEDTNGNATRFPTFLDPIESAEYLGTVLQDPSLTNALPVLHWFIAPNAGSALDGGTSAPRCALFWHDEFYDNVRFTRQGVGSTGFRKKNYHVDFTRDHDFRWAEHAERVNDIFILSTYPDKSHMRNMLAYGVHRDAGLRSPHHFVVPIRLQSNGTFYGTAHLVEDADETFLRRIGRDDRGALYKMNDPMVATGPNEKKTRLFEDKSDLQELISRASTVNPTHRQWIHDNVDISETINYLAAMVVTANADCCHENYYLYRDSEGDGEWEMFPSDVDLSFGRNWSSSQSYWDDALYWSNGLFIGGNATLPAALFASGSPTRAMYLRRVRTLQDQLLGTNGTPQSLLYLEPELDRWAKLLTPDALLDLEKWGTWGGGAQNLFPESPTYSQYVQTVPQHVNRLKTNYLVNRRNFVFGQRMNSPEFPDAQPASISLTFGAMDINPSSGNQQEEFIELINTNAIAVDISGWRLNGSIIHTFQAGVVLPPVGSSNRFYVAADKRAFRNRTTPPHGGMGLYVEGPYRGELSARGGSVSLADPSGRMVATRTFPATPTPAQQYLRITEINYHPPLGSEGFDPEDFEFIELQNTGPIVLGLRGLSFTRGISFNFTNSTLSSLNPGERLVLVKRVDTFVLRYGEGRPVAGQYTGSLANEGERLTLEDGGEVVLDFSYRAEWYPITDGPGFSLVVVNPTSPLESLDESYSWRPSGVEFGTPGMSDPGSTPIPGWGVVVNEVLANSESPFEDVIELLNRGPQPVDISGWYLSDDIERPRKFRLPQGTPVLEPGALISFDEHAFNPNINPRPTTSFSFKTLGDAVHLFSADEQDRLTGYHHGFRFGPSPTNTSFGLHVTSHGREDFVLQQELSFSLPNAGPRVGPIVISEIHPYPLLSVANGQLQENTQERFIELHNISDQPVPLFDPGHPDRTWRLEGSLGFAFPPGLTLPAGGYLLLVTFDPRLNPEALAAFRARNGANPSVPVVGPYTMLSSSFWPADIQLCQPLPEKETNSSVNAVACFTVDRVRHENKPPGPVLTWGIGLSLQRNDHSAYGDDPSNWRQDWPQPGRDAPSPSRPQILRHPAATWGPINGETTISVTATSDSPLFYQWLFNGNIIPNATNQTLRLSNLQWTSAGDYAVIVFNDHGALRSQAGLLTVSPGISIHSPPTNILVRIPPDPAAAPRTNATFRVTATTEVPPLSFQWRFNGVDLPGETNTSIEITDITLDDEGLYTCVLSDSRQTLITPPAALLPLITPRFLVPPLNQQVVTGATVSVSVVLSGSPLPFQVEWRRGSIPVQTNIVSRHEDYWTFNAPMIPVTNQLHRLVIKNAATSLPGVFTNFYVTTLVDTDADGLPDDYEMAQGLNSTNSLDAALDIDGDGMKNADEYLAGTDPQDPQSYLRIEPPAALDSPAGPTISFLAMSNRTYSVEARDSVEPAPWRTVAEAVATPTNRVVQLLDPLPVGSNSRPTQFYRLVTPRQPSP